MTCNDIYAAENMYDAWDNGDRHEIRQQFARREELIRMARDSGMELYGLGKDREKFIYHLEAFAALVAAAERNACAKVCENMALEWTEQPNIAQAERATMLECAAAILARGRT